MPKIIGPCTHCGAMLPLWNIKCSNCRRWELSGFHVIVFVLTGVPVFILFVKLFLRA